MKNKKPPPDLPEGRRVKRVKKPHPQPLSKGRGEWNEEGKGKNAI